MARTVKFNKRGDFDPAFPLEIFKTETVFDFDAMPAPIMSGLVNEDSTIEDSEGTAASSYLVTSAFRFDIQSTTKAIESFSPNTSYSGFLSSTDDTIHSISINIDYQKE